ncbi:MAG: prolipoprotein diacylglyceryl transferase [Planctomycetota bacterium]|nr:prolipoprotein diacylglyceryl transferase [Planctomycetota bacterium]GIK51731.1 MAG: prolipoprotein diacylglyceryl transferase [Planctomycetota bacterium]
MLGYLEFPNWNPVVIDLTWLLPNAALRWYGLTYVISFAFGYAALWFMQRRGYLRIAADDVVNYMIVGVIGVFAGGRLGEILFYQFDYTFLSDQPLSERLVNVLRVWDGGMSFHGGLIGVTLAVLLFSRFRRQNFFNVMDGCTQFMPFGIACVRFGNFIGGDLYGRVITDESGRAIYEGSRLPWYAMKFPTDPEALTLIARHVPSDTWRDHNPLPVAPEVWAKVEPFVPGRYPSQLLQMLLEGLLLWFTLIFLRRYCRKPGMLASLLCVFYGVYRFPVEFLREPDPHLNPSAEGLSNFSARVLHALQLTMGQALCVGLFLFGLVMLFYCWRSNGTGMPYSDDELRMRAFTKKAAPQGAASPAKP